MASHMPVYPAREMPDTGGADRTFAYAVSLFGREDDDLAVLVDRRYKYIQPPATLT